MSLLPSMINLIIGQLIGQLLTCSLNRILAKKVLRRKKAAAGRDAEEPILPASSGETGFPYIQSIHIIHTLIHQVYSLWALQILKTLYPDSTRWLKK